MDWLDPLSGIIHLTKIIIEILINEDNVVFRSVWSPMSRQPLHNLPKIARIPDNKIKLPGAGSAQLNEIR